MTAKNSSIALAKILFKAAVNQIPPEDRLREIADRIDGGDSLIALIEELLRTDERKRLEWASAAARRLYVTPGHFFSPHPDQDEARAALAQAETAWSDARSLPAITLNDEKQLALWEALQPHIQDTSFSPKPVDGQRYYYNSGFFSKSDAIILASMMRYFRPARLVEIGSGLSSACALDTAERHLDGNVRFVFIDPNPERLMSVLGATDHLSVEILGKKVQEVSLDVFRSLGPDDILFIDSSHVLKTGSDLCFELFEILPALQPGVIVHFHDIFFPFEYSERFVLEQHRDWNEAYAVRAFLMFNKTFEIIFFNDYIAAKSPEEVQRIMNVHNSPHPLGSSLWLRKLE